MAILGVFLNRHIKTGAHKRYMRLLSSLGERGHRVILACPKSSEAEAVPNVEILSVLNLEKRFRFLTLLRILKNLHLHRGSSRLLVFGFPNAVMGLLLKFAMNLPLIVGIRGYLIDARSINIQAQRGKTYFARFKLPFIYLMERCLYRYSDLVTLQSEHHKVSVIKRYGLGNRISGKIHVIPNDIPHDVWQSRTRDPSAEDSFILLYVGNQTRRKGLAVLLRAIKLLGEEGLPRAIKLRIVGVEEQRWLSPPPPDSAQVSVEFLGWRNDVSDLMREADLLVVPSLNEPFPNVVLEALAVDLPVIGSGVGGIWEILGDDGLVFPPGNPGALKEMIFRVIEDRSFYSMVTERCLDRKRHFLFDWTAQFERLIISERLSK